MSVGTVAPQFASAYIGEALQLAAIDTLTVSMAVGANSSFTVRINSAQTANTDIALATDNPFEPVYAIVFFDLPASEDP